MGLTDQDLLRLSELLDRAADCHTGYDELSTGGRWWDDREEDAEEGTEVSQTLITRWMNDSFFRLHSCPFCARLLYSLSVDSRQVRLGERIPEALSLSLRVCRPCRYWAVLSEEFENDPFSIADAPVGSTLALSKLRDFGAALPDGLAQETALHLRRHPKLWNRMDPARLERVVTELFRSVEPGARARHVGRPDDDGVDVVFVDGNGQQWLVQVKRREKASVGEPVETVRSLLGTMLLKDGSHGMVVTTATHFSHRALENAERALRRGYTVRCINRGLLDEMLNPRLPKAPWLSYTRDQTETFEGGLDVGRRVFRVVKLWHDEMVQRSTA